MAVGMCKPYSVFQERLNLRTPLGLDCAKHRTRMENPTLHDLELAYEAAIRTC